MWEENELYLYFDILLLFDLNLFLTQSTDKVGAFLILRSLTKNRNQLRTEGSKLVLLRKNTTEGNRRYALPCPWKKRNPDILRI